jgi:hypothetical protein
MKKSKRGRSSIPSDGMGTPKSTVSLVHSIFGTNVSNMTSNSLEKGFIDYYIEDEKNEVNRKK